MAAKNREKIITLIAPSWKLFDISFLTLQYG